MVDQSGEGSVELDALSATLATSRESLDALVPELYRELRSIASHQLAHGRRAGLPDGTLATTALVNEAYLKLSEQHATRWASQSHFLAVVAVAMRQILIDRARARIRLKRGGGERPVTLTDPAAPAEDSAETLLEINDALDALAAVEPRLARVVECRFFGGLSEEEIAEALDVTVRTVQRDWVKARLLLRRALGG